MLGIPYAGHLVRRKKEYMGRQILTVLAGILLSVLAVATSSYLIIIVRHPKHLDTNGVQVPEGTMRTLFSLELRDVTEIFITSFGELTDTLLTENDGVPNLDEADD
jgi:hypothetical protein